MSIVSQPDYSFLYEDIKEIWIEKLPEKGAHIRVSRGLYCHHGVYISEDEVIHFTGKDGDNVLDWSKPEVIKTDLSYFLKDGVLEVKEYTEQEFQDLYPTDHIVQYARACLGDKGYNLVFNNCEHFANVCTLGRFRSGQVEKIFDAILAGASVPWKRRNNMGLLGKIGGAIKSLFGGSSSGGNRSTSSTTYEPDKVKVAEIEADTKLRLAGMENERIEIMKNARLELLEFETQSNIALEEAKVKGLNFMAQTIVAMQDKLNEVTEKRLQIIEKGSLSIIKEIEGFYGELEHKIQADNDDYNLRKFPLFLETMQKFEKGSDAYNMYKEKIDKDADAQLQLMMKQFDNVSKRQSQIIDGFLRSKDKIIEQTGQITAGILEQMVINHNDLASLEVASEDQYMLASESRDKMMLEEGK